MVQVGIREILTLAWDYPLCTGGLALMFTPPMFRVIVFFSPVLICTALCAVALISVGQQIEVARETGIAGSNVKIVEGEGLSARSGRETGQQSVGGENIWLKFVQGLEQAVSASNKETERRNSMNDVNKEEGGLKEYAFRVAESPMQFLNDQDRLDHINRQIEEFREYERKFREKARTDSVADVAFPNFGKATGARNVGPLEDIWLKSVQGFESPVSVSNNATEKSNWMSSVYKEEEGLKKNAYRVAEGPMQFLDDQDRLDHLDRQIEAFREYERKFREKTRTEPVAAGASATVEAWKAGASPGTRSSSSGGIITAPEETHSNCDVPARKIPPMVLYNLRTGGTGKATMSSSGAGAAALPSWASGAPAAVTGLRKEAIARERRSYDSFDRLPRNDNVCESSSEKQRRTEPSAPPLPLPLQKQTNDFEKDTIATTPAVEMQARVFATGKSLNHNAPMRNVDAYDSMKPAHRLDVELAGFTSKDFGREKDSRKTSAFAPQCPAIVFSSVKSPAKQSEESNRAATRKESRRSLSAPRSPRNNLTRVASPAKHFEDRSLRRSTTCSSSLRSGNAVIYNAGSDSSGSTSRRKSFGSVQRRKIQ